MANAILDTGFTSGGVDGVYNFRINGAPPFTTLKAFVNGIDYTSLMAPGPNYSTGDDLITDQYGFIFSALAYAAVYIKSYLHWKRDE
jgi:hypothetical protein